MSIHRQALARPPARLPAIEISLEGICVSPSLSVSSRWPASRLSDPLSWLIQPEWMANPSPQYCR